MPYPVTVLSFLMTFPTGNQYLMVHSVDSCPSFPGISATWKIELVILFLQRQQRRGVRKDRCCAAVPGDLSFRCSQGQGRDKPSCVASEQDLRGAAIGGK